MINWGVYGIFTNYVGLAAMLSDRTASVIPTINTVSDQFTIITRIYRFITGGDSYCS